jgi:DNA helicase II / ATP-dependent DNA helicase PcrA
VNGPLPTPEQVAVVDHPMVPLRVAAGAGTGKTSTIVARLVAAVEAGLEPEATLGITFTNKAAEELSDRLRKALPGPAADGREVEVTTYHGFAYSLLQEYGAFVGVERDAQVVGPGYVRQLMLESLPGRAYEYLDLTAPMWRVAEAATLAAQLGDNLKTAGDLRASAGSGEGDVWGARRELLEIVAAYEVAKQRLGVVDYADLIRLSHRLVSLHPWVARRVRDRYRLVLLDEYQDTAPSQRELLVAVFGRGFPITAVGDADQTIYGWRGASLANFAAFPDHFGAAEGPAVTLPLTVNHRSGPAILHLANAVRGMLHDEEPFHRLVPTADAPPAEVEARWFRDARLEAMWLAGEVRRLHDEEDLAWRDMAVLFRKNRHITLVRDALESAGVPVEVASLGGLLDVPEVADLRAWLRLLAHPDDAPALIRILLGSRHRLGLGDVLHLSERAAAQLPERGPHDERAWPLLEAVDSLGEIAGLTAEARRRLEEFRDAYRRLLVVAQGVALDELCRRILEELGAWSEIDAMDDAAGLSARLNLYRFLDLAQDWSPLEGRTSLDAFLDHLDLLSDEQWGDELDTARVGGENAVTLLTVHRAKGLEWDTVFLPAVAKDIFPARSLGYDRPDKYARFLPYELRLDADSLPALDGSDADRDDRVRSRHRDGEWRTAYVAVTRAKRRLHLTGAWWYAASGKPRPPSELFELACSCDFVHVAARHEDPGEAPERLAIDTIAGAPDPLFADGWQQVLRDAMADPGLTRRAANDPAAYDAKVEQLRMVVDGLPLAPDPVALPDDRVSSVSALVTLAGCPRRYYWSEVDPLPRRPAAWLRRGVEVHRRIELHNLGHVAFEELDNDLYDLPSEAERGREDRPGDAASAFAVFSASRFAAARPRFVEAPIELHLADGWIRGRIDAIYEPEPGTWEIVDFKSGSARHDDAALVQLEAYAVAAAAGAVHPDPPQRMSVTFAYLGGGELTEIPVEVTDVWLASAERHLVALLETAAGADFDPTPSPACTHCDFLAYCDAGREHVEAG